MKTELLQQYQNVMETSFNQAVTLVGKKKLAVDFFDLFFQRYPETLSYFKGSDLEVFAPKKLDIIYTFFIDIVAHPNFVEGRLSEEVIRHQMYGLHDQEYYFFLIDCLIASLEMNLGEQWSEETSRSWQELASAFKAIIQNAASAFL
jgi:hemoglobin-like flavoprotein